MFFRRIWMMAVALLGATGTAYYVVMMLSSIAPKNLPADVKGVGMGIFIISLPLVLLNFYAALQLGNAARRGRF